ncbi:MAG: S-layer homology domain-containing protein [Patescibacteria group bacterium]
MMKIQKRLQSPLRIVSIAIVAVIILFLLEKATAAPYIDVPSRSWYEQIVQQFKDAGLLHRVRTNFKPSDNAIRADFMQLMLDVQGGITVAAPRNPSFNDVGGDTWFYPYIEEAARLGWVKGDGNCFGTRPCYTRPNGNVNRAEAAALLVRAFGFEQTGVAPHFSDNIMGQWYTNVIQTTADHCILQGDDATGKVRPADYMNRAEMVAMIDRARKRLTYGIDCGKIQQVAPKISVITPLSETRIAVDFNRDLNAGSVTDTLRYKITNDKDIIVTEAKLVRPQGVELAFSRALVSGKAYNLSVTNMVTAQGTLFADTASFKGYVATTPSDSTLTLTPMNVSTTKKSIPKGALRVSMLSVDFTASCDSGLSIEGVTLTREGFGSRTDIDGVYAVVGGERLTRKRTIEAQNNTVSLHFTRPIVVPACSSKRVDFVADIAAGASVSGEHRLTIRTARDVESNAQRVQSFPVKGGTYTVAAVTTGAVTVEYRTVAPSEVKVGGKGVAIGKFSVTANSVENQVLTSILLNQDGSLKPGDIENIRIRKTNGEVLTNVANKLTTDYVLLTFNPSFVVKQGDNISLEIVADIIGGAGRTIQFKLEEESDLFAVGSVHGKVGGFGSRVAILSKSPPALVAVDAGGFIVETDGPPQQSYGNDARGAVLANVLFTSGNEPASVRSMYVLVQAQTIAGTGIGAGSGSDDEIVELIKNVKLRNLTKGNTVSGVRLSGSNDSLASTQKTYQIYRFDNFNVRGKENWRFEVDFTNNGQGRHPLSGDRFRIFICGEPTHINNTAGAATTNTTGCDFGGALSDKSTAYQIRVEGLTTGDRITDVRPRGSIAGNFHTIATAALTIAQQSTGASDITVKGAKDVTLMRFETRAGSARDILLTRLSFEAEAGSLLNGQNYTLWVDTNGDSEVDTVLQRGASPQGSLLTFDRFIGGGYTIPSTKVINFEVHSAIATSPTSSTLQLKFATNSANFIEAEKVDGSNLSGIRMNGSCTDTCDISVTTGTANLWTIVSQGNLFVAKSSTPVRQQQLLGGTASDPVLRLVLRADNEPVDVTDIQITTAQSNASSIERLELYNGGDSKPFASATTSGCGNATVINTREGVAVSTFCATMNNQRLVVQAGVDVTVIVRAMVKSDTNGGTSNQIAQFWIAGQTSGGVKAVRARGMASSTDLIANNADSSGQGEVIIGRNTFGANADILGSQHRVVMAKITGITNANPDLNGTAVPVGTADIGQFAFTAASNSNSKNGLNEVVLDNIIFTVNALNVALDGDNFRLVRANASEIEHPCSTYSTIGTPMSGIVNGQFLVSCTDLIASALSTTISKGDTAIFSLRVTVTNPSLGKSSTLQVSLQNMTDATKTSFDTTQSHIEWLDRDGQTSQSFFWTDLQTTTVNSTTYRN